VAHRIESGMVWINSHKRPRPAHPVRRREGLRLARRAGTAPRLLLDQQAIHLTLGDVHTTRFGDTGYPRTTRASPSRQLTTTPITD
jgi:5-carboxymethyl-2-hydroxymuconic-semialdehyde dehydrogenase